MSLARTIMIQGTSSHVGKSVLTAALCRIFRQAGLRVAPFKAQNMALNSYVTAGGGEIGRAQALQAEAAGVDVTVDMNPILIKPSRDMEAQVVVLGRPAANLQAGEYGRRFARTEGWRAVTGALGRLRAEYDVVVIEGAGSPAEVNLKEGDIVNMRVAREADAPVLLVADIDRGGALAALVGTLQLLEEDERERVKGLILNKFRGDIELLKPAISFLENYTGKPVLGVIPHIDGLGLDEEDSVSLTEALPQKDYARGQVEPVEDGARDRVDVAVIRLPRISNFTDFDPLARMPGARVRYVAGPEDLGKPDLVIIPGTKNTIEDLEFLRQTGLAAAIAGYAAQGLPVIGICGGYQMLGVEISDPHGMESDQGCVEGLGLLPVSTTFEPEKTTRRVRARVAGRGPFFEGMEGGQVAGYEIHMGRTQAAEGFYPAFRVESGGQAQTGGADGTGGVEAAGANGYPDGCVNTGGNVFGTYLHGLFDNDAFRWNLINRLRERKGLPPLEKAANLDLRAAREEAFERLAGIVRQSLRMDLLFRIAGIEESSEKG
ncbi:MAG: cobyric acid synthase [Firmicutes bacterium]|nr:cobyric acid synthase [Bacillota bacterium]